MKDKIKKAAHRTGKFAISKGKFIMMFVGIAILVLLIQKVGLSELIGVWDSMNKFYVMLALVPWMLTLVFSAYRLKRIVNSDICFFDMFKIYIYGYLLNYASPIQGFGAGAKIAMLKMKNVKISRSSASVSSEIAYDILLTAVIAAIFFVYHINFLLTRLKGIVNTDLMLFGAAIILMFAIAAFILRKNRFVKEFSSHLLDSFSMKNMASIMPLTLFSWILPSLMIYLFFIAIGADVGFLVILGSLSISFILGLATFIPGGLGIRDAITAYICSISNVPIETTISIALFNRFFTIGTVLIMVVCIKIYELRKEK